MGLTELARRGMSETRVAEDGFFRSISFIIRQNCAIASATHEPEYPDSMLDAFAFVSMPVATSPTPMAWAMGWKMPSGYSGPRGGWLLLRSLPIPESQKLLVVTGGEVIQVAPEAGLHVEAVSGLK